MNLLSGIIRAGLVGWIVWLFHLWQSLSGRWENVKFILRRGAAPTGDSWNTIAWDFFLQGLLLPGVTLVVLCWIADGFRERELRVFPP